MRNDEFVANYLYKEAVKEEKIDRKNPSEKHDFEIIDAIINEMNQLGYNLKYEADLRLREFHDKALISIYSKYYLKFENLGHSEDLLSMIDKRGFYESMPLVINLYEQIKKQEGLHQIASCDNSFVNIQDKNYLPTFLDYLKNEEDVIRLPLTMLMLAKWRVKEAKPFYRKYLEHKNREIVFTAIECLSYYEDPDSSSKKAISEKLNSQDKDIVLAAKKALNRMTKQMKSKF